MRAIFLSDGSEIALTCAWSVSKRSNIQTLALVVGDKVNADDAKTIANTLGEKTRIVQTPRPDLDPFIISLMESNKIDVIFSCYFEYRIRAELLNAARIGGTNIHPSVLPYNGGYNTSFWGIYDQTPLGGTIHWLSPELDSGAIIAQKVFEDDGVMNASYVRERQRQICAELFEENIDDFLAGKFQRSEAQGCYFHKRSEIIKKTSFFEKEKITLEKLMRLGRATRFENNGLKVKTEDGRLFVLSVDVQEIKERSN